MGKNQIEAFTCGIRLLKYIFTYVEIYICMQNSGIEPFTGGLGLKIYFSLPFLCRNDHL